MKTFWQVAVGLLVVAVVVSLISLYGDSRPVGSENLVGRALPAFAAPLATGRLTGDANVYTPSQARAAHSTAACDVRLPGAFNSCDELGGAAIVTFINTTRSACTRYVQTLERFVRDNPAVNAVVVTFDETEANVRAFVRRSGWRLPVAIDRDGAVAALYAVAGCPTTFFAADGRVTGVELGVLDAAQLAKMLDRSSGAATGATSRAEDSR